MNLALEAPPAKNPLAPDQLSIVKGDARPDFLLTETLADIFEATAKRFPDDLALSFAERTLTYAELNQQADHVAAHLYAASVGAGKVVGLCLPRGVELLVMQLAIAKTGAAWLPCESDTPVERIKACLSDADAIGIITDYAHLHDSDLAACVPHAWNAEDLLAELPPSIQNLAARRDPTQAAYLIYTSGSTGKPKGIAITHASICHFLRSENSVLGVRHGDKVYQGFSVSFDMSFEEIWISYLVGATLWIAPKELTSDPEALPRVLQEQQITVLHAVPTLLALFSQDVPSLRIINLGGEACPQSLVERWAKPERRMFNTYGPTEATVSASLAELRADESVTIGKPLPNYNLLVIAADVENGLRLLPQGEVGELCISGPGVAPGYVKRPELSAEKFLANPWCDNDLDARIYRTGDLARVDAAGQVQCLGRSDDQVKIRGFRVELGEIEGVLARQSGVGTAAVVLISADGIDQLIAYVVPENDQIETTDLRKQLQTALRETLPVYMLPSRYVFMTAVPRLSSGKIDRKALKAMPLPIDATANENESEHPATPGEEVLFAALHMLFPGHAIHRHADFFDDLGGHSLLAARLASMIRQDARFEFASVRDIYQQRTVSAIAQVLDQHSKTPIHEAKAWQAPSTYQRWSCGVAQACVVPWLVAIRMAQWLMPFFTYHYYTGEPGDSIPLAIGMSVLMFVATIIVEFVLAIVGKRIVAPRLKAGKYPLWGSAYFRWWLADRLAETAPVYLLSGSSLYAWWLRALGAKIGRDTNIGSITIRAPELLSIGDGVSIGNAVNFENARVYQGELHLGTISLAANAYVDSYCVLEGNTQVEEYGHLEGQSSLRAGQSIPARQVYVGSPAQYKSEFNPAAQKPRPACSFLRRIAEGIFFATSALSVAVLFFLPVFPCFALIDWLDEGGNWSALPKTEKTAQFIKFFILSMPASAALIVFTALLAALIRWCILPPQKPGTWPVHSNLYCRKWFVNQIQESSLHVLHGVYATVFAPLWYRLLGAKIGKNAEISTAQGVVPDMLTLGDDTFIADAVMLGDEHIDGGWMSMAPTVVSSRSFVGNGAYIPDGTTLPPNVLIGVLSTVPSAEKIKSGDTWAGSPPIYLPARENVSRFPEHLTFRPSILRRLSRALIEAFRIVAPHALVIAAGYVIVRNVMPYASDGKWAKVLLHIMVCGLLYGIASFVVVWLFKLLCVGRYEKRAVPMWTPFVWLSEAATNLFEGIAVPNFLRYLRGTPWLPIAMNWLGCKIGKGVYLDTTDMTEFDCIHIGDYAELNALSCPQTHLFEDRIMKIDHVHIGEHANLGPRSTVLYSASLGDNATLGPLTLVMKGEHIPAASQWHGCPAAPISI